jgi:hypothetical protein
MASISLQDLRRRLYIKAKADKDWRFWGLYVHVVKLETLRPAYDLAKRNNGAPGIDGVTFEAIETVGVEAFLVQLRDELVQRNYRPQRSRRVEIPKDGGTSFRSRRHRSPARMPGIGRGARREPGRRQRAPPPALRPQGAALRKESQPTPASGGDHHSDPPMILTD